MDKECANWCRFAQLIINKGAEVLRQLLLLEIVTSMFTKYSQYWRENVHDPLDIKYSARLWTDFHRKLNCSTESSENILRGLLYSWKSGLGKETTIMEEIEELKQWTNDINKQIVKSASTDVKITLNSWLSQIQQEIQRLNPICKALSQWDATFLRHLYSAQHSLLLEIEENDRFISHCSATILLLSPLSSRRTFQEVVPIIKKALSAWKTKCHWILSSFEEECNNLIISMKRDTQDFPQSKEMVMLLDNFKDEISTGNVKSNVEFFCGKWYNDVEKVFERYEKKTQEVDSTSVVLNVAQSLSEELEKLSFREQKIKNFFIQIVLDSNDMKLSNKQLSKLKDISSSTDLNKLDLTLLVVVWIKRKIVHYPLLERDQDSHDWDTSITADIQRLRSYRNKIVAHIEQARISSETFENLWKEAKIVLCRIASRCGDNFETTISREIDQMKNDSLEPHREFKLRQEFTMWCQNNIKDEFSALSPEADRYLGMLKSIQRVEHNVSSSMEEKLGNAETLDEMQGEENLKRIDVSNQSSEYQQLESIFLTEARTGPYSNRICNVQNMKVVKIERIQNKTLYQQYSAKRKSMETRYKDMPHVTIERKVWHGTTYDSAESICTHGFNRSYCGISGGWFGRGVYFATNASYAARSWLSAGIQVPKPGTKQCIFYVSVCVGEYIKGDPHMRFTPAKSKSNPTDTYDSAVNDVNNVVEIVIFNDTQAYPEYLITFTT